MAKSDGQVIIEARIDTEKAEKDLKNLENKVQKTAKNIEKTNVKVKVDSNTDKATKDLKSLESKAKDLSKNKAKVSVSADVEAADADLVRLKAQAKTLDKMKVEAAVKAETVSAAANLARMQAQMHTISQMKAKATVTADSAQAEEKTSKLKGLIKTLVDKVHKVIVDADTTGAMANLAALNEKTKKASSGIKSMLTSVGVVNAVSAAFNTVKQSVSSAFSRIDTMNQFNRTVTAITGSAESAGIALGQLKDITKGTAYGLDVAAKATQNFVTRGLDISQATDQVRIWGDAVSFYGKGTNEQFENVTDALAKMRTKGKVEMDQLDRLFEAGIDAVGMYAQATGRSSAEVQDDLSYGRISAEEFINTVSTAMQEGTNGVLSVAGAAKEAGASWAGTFDNAVAACARGMQAIIDSIEAALAANGLPTMKESIANLGKAFEEMAGKVAAVMPQVIDKLTWFIDHGDAVIGVIGAIASAFVVLKVAGAIGSVFAAFDKAKDVLKKAGKEITFLNKAFEVIGMGPIPIIIAAVAALVGALVVAYNTSETFRKAVNNLFGKLGEMAAPFKPILDSLIDSFKKMGEALAPLVQDLLASLKPVLDGIIGVLGILLQAIIPVIMAQVAGFMMLIQALMPVIQFLLEVITVVFTGIFEIVGAVLGGIVTFFNETLPMAIQAVGDWFMQLPQKIGEAFNTALATVQQWGSNVWNFFTQTIPAWMESIRLWFEQLPYNIGYALGYALASIGQWCVDTWNYLVTNVPLWIDGVRNWFAELPGKLWECLLTAIANVILWGANVKSEMESAASNTILNVITFFQELPGRMKAWLDQAVSNVISWGQEMWNSASQAASDTFNAIVDGLKDLPNKIKEIGGNIVTGIWNGINEKIDWLKGKIGDFFNGILAGSQDAIDSHSPSRKFRDVIGKMIPAGIGVGIQEGMPAVKELLSNELDNLTNLTTPIVSVASNINTENTISTKALSSNILAKEPEGEQINYVQGIAEDIDAEWQKVSDSTTTKWQAIKAFLETTWAAIKQNTLNTAALMTHEIQGRFTTNYSTINNLTTSFASMMGQQWQRVLSQITAVLDRISSASSSKFNEVKNTAISIMNGLPSALYNVGVSAMNDLISGINSRQGDANNAASNLVESLLNKFKEGLGIASPSREMFSIGQYMLQGLINGLDGDNLLKFVDNIVGTIKDNFSNINLKQLISAMGSDVTKLWQKLGINFGSGAFGEGGMMWPTDSQSITSYFGGRDSPGGIGSTNHMGIDIGASEGTPIYAALPGTVTTAGWYGGYGNAVIIDHGGGMQTLYGHMSAVGTSPGMNVMPGQVIGFVGSTGNSTGPHLHFSVIQDGQWLDPLAFFPGFKVGSKYIPNDMLAYLHEGEAVVRKDENPHANSKGSFWTDILKGAVNSQNASIQNETSQFFYNTTNMVTNNNNNETIQNIYFQETPKRPSEFRQALKQEGRRLAFGKQGL